MKLYVTDTSPYARIVRIVVLEKGLAGRIELITAQTRTPASPFYKINPSGKVPYLVREDGIGFEDSSLICSYLDQSYGDSMFDIGSGEEAWELRRLKASAASLLEGIAVWARELRRRSDERSPTIIAHELDRSERMIELWERQIDHPLMQGDLNMAQIILITTLQLDVMIPEFKWRLGHPRLAAWADRVGARPSVAATMPQLQG
ncbi:MAG: hypothetical protein GTO41_25960 [Burkholderiales bacterium]|nr:hypothetical protein [Burkholderiales bacterium]